MDKISFKEKAQKLKRDIPAVFLALKHKDTPWYAKIIAGLTVGYALSPIDLVPDFIPVLGYLDDIIILPLLIAFVIWLIPSDVFKECLKTSEGMWENGKPKKWYFAIPIIIIWLVVIGVIIYLLKRIIG